MPWPISEPDYGSFRFFVREVGMFCGFGADHNLWTEDQDGYAKRLVQQGVMQVYYPPAVDEYQHEWTWMRPLGGIKTSANQAVYDLPEDFERIDGTLTYDDDNNCYDPIHLCSDQQIRSMNQVADYTAPPTRAAVRPKTSVGLSAQRQELVLYPTPDSSYALQFRYHALPRQLSDTYTFPLGGPAYAELFAASCLSAAELKRDNKQGPMHAAFKQRLSTAVAQDLRRGPQKLGYNGDAKTQLGLSRRRNRDAIFYDTITYGGTDYSSGQG